MLRVNNKTPFEVNLTPLTNSEGYEVLSVFFTASCVLINEQWRVCSEQKTAPTGDEFWNPDEPSSIKYPSQLAFDKPSTDIIINGAAVAPQQQGVSALEVSVAVGTAQASLHVYGERSWNRGYMSKPQLFQRIPLIWENAYGGNEIEQNKSVSYEHNSLGKGWKPDSWGLDDYNGVLLPNIEWPQQLIRSPLDRPIPAGFGAVPLNAQERVQYAGTHDERWQTTRAPFVPEDFNPRFFCAAIPALQYQGLMRGDETVILKHLNQQSILQFQLPGTRPKGEVKTEDKTYQLSFTLQTVVIESEDLIARMFWQALMPISRTLADIRETTVTLA